MSEADSHTIARKPKLRWYQFTVRGLMGFVTRIAILCSLVACLSLVPGSVSQQVDTAAAIKDLGGSVRWSSPSGPSWLQSLLGDNFFRHVQSANLDNVPIGDADLEKLEKLNGLSRIEELSLKGTRVTDEGIRKLQQALPNCKIER